MNNARTSHEDADTSSSTDRDQPYLPAMEQYMRDHIARVLDDARSAGLSAVPTKKPTKSNKEPKETKKNA